MKKIFLLSTVLAIFAALSSCGPKEMKASFSNTGTYQFNIEGQRVYGVKDSASNAVIVSNLYTKIFHCNGYFLVNDAAGKFIVFARNGENKIVIPAKNTIKFDSEKSCFTISNDAEKGYFFTNEGVLICGNYDFLDIDQHGNLHAAQNSKEGIISKAGKEIIPFEYEKIAATEKGYIAARAKGKAKLLDAKGNISINNGVFTLFNTEGKESKTAPLKEVRSVFASKK